MQTTPLVAGLGVAALAYASRAAVLTFQSFKAAPPRLRQFYKVRLDRLFISLGAAGAVGRATRVDVSVPACQGDPAAVCSQLGQPALRGVHAEKLPHASREA